jgi:hypothetical protein
VNHPEQMTQTAPYPAILADLVGRLRYRGHLGWQVWLEDDCQRDKPGRHTGESRGLTLIVQRCGPNTYHPEQVMEVNHYFAVPPATYNGESWMRWLFDRLGDVDTHERMEDFALAYEGDPAAAVVRPYAPNHGPGQDPYRVCEYATDEARRTSFRGVLDDDGTGRSRT